MKARNAGLNRARTQRSEGGKRKEKRRGVRGGGGARGGGERGLGIGTRRGARGRFESKVQNESVRRGSGSGLGGAVVDVAVKVAGGPRQDDRADGQYDTSMDPPSLPSLELEQITDIDIDLPTPTEQKSSSASNATSHCTEGAILSSLEGCPDALTVGAGACGVVASGSRGACTGSGRRMREKAFKCPVRDSFPVSLFHGLYMPYNRFVVPL